MVMSFQSACSDALNLESKLIVFGLLEIQGVIDFYFMGSVSNYFEFKASIMYCTSMFILV